MQEELTVSTQRLPINGDHVLCVTLKGDFVWSSNVALDEIALEQLETNTRAIMIDLSDVGIIDSRGLGLLTTLSVRIIKKKMGFVLVGVSSRIEDMMRASSLVGLFVIKETQQEAMDYLRSGCD